MAVRVESLACEPKVSGASEPLSTYLYYDGEVGRANYTSNNVSGGVRMAF